MAARRKPAGAVISACLIVKDEEANLPRCLASLQGKVDEIVVVDTGSTDRTVALAEAAGARVFHFEWCDDFSAARNESLSHAAGSHILWVDADDELIERAPGALRSLCDASNQWGCFLDVHCPGTDPGESTPVVRQWRLFPRAAGVRFEGRIHEHPAAPRVISADDVRQQDGVYVIHWGYTAGPEAMRRKLERNRRLIERTIADDPRQPRHYFNLGSQLVAEDRPAEALAVLLQGIDRWFEAHGADTGYVPALFATAAACALATGQPQAALDLEARTPAQFVSSDLLYSAGLACRELGRPVDAAARWQRAVSDPLAIGNILADRDCLQRAQRELEALRPRISACLIVKNEEADLPRCLASIRDQVDDIVVVDTGSSDRTVEIAESFGARVSHFEWCDDFSAARNFSLSQTSSDFLLWVDADDELIVSEPGALWRLALTLPADSWAYWVDVHCPTDQWQESETIVRQPRLFRNGAGLGFRGRLHEQLGAPDGFRPEALTFQEGMRIKHWGYIPHAGANPGRSSRNRRILDAEIAQNPDDHFLRYNLALQLAGDKEFELALPAFEQAIELWARKPGDRTGHVGSMFAMAALCAVEQGEYDKVLDIERRTPAEHRSADLVFQAGLAWWGLGRGDEALACFDQALTDESLRDHNSHDVSTSSWRPLIMKAAVHLDRGAFEQARDCAAAALAISPTRPDGLYLLACAANGLGDAAEAVRLCRQTLAGERDDGFKAKTRRLLLNLANDLDDAALALEALDGEVADLSPAGALYLEARALGAAGQTQRQLDLLVAGCSEYPADADLRLALSQLLETHGALAEAAGVLSQALEHPPVPAAIYQRLAIVLARLGQLEDAANALELANRAAAEPELVGA
jgi:glycosyltransferase involved in cell wall biosynthesis/predicted Zn-dependent protease